MHAFPKADILLRADGSPGCLEQDLFTRWLRLRWLNSNFCVAAGRECRMCCHWKNQAAERLGNQLSVRTSGVNGTQGCGWGGAGKSEGGEGAWRMQEDSSNNFPFLLRYITTMAFSVYLWI